MDGWSEFAPLHSINLLCFSQGAAPGGREQQWVVTQKIRGACMLGWLIRITLLHPTLVLVLLCCAHRVQYDEDGSSFWVTPKRLRKLSPAVKPIMVAYKTAEYRWAAVHNTSHADCCLEIGCHAGEGGTTQMRLVPHRRGGTIQIRVVPHR